MSFFVRCVELEEEMAISLKGGHVCVKWTDDHRRLGLTCVKVFKYPLVEAHLPNEFSV